jgi:hypothetical protein
VERRIEAPFVLGVQEGHPGAIQQGPEARIEHEAFPDDGDLRPQRERVLDGEPVPLRVATTRQCVPPARCS